MQSLLYREISFLEIAFWLTWYKISFHAIYQIEEFVQSEEIQHPIKNNLRKLWLEI